MKKYLIQNMGCDDTTVFEIELTDEELKVVLKFIKLNNEKSTYGCQPEIAIYTDYFYNKNGKPISCVSENGIFYEATNLLKEEKEVK